MYTAEINRNNPTAILFLIDQSQSMGQTFGDSGMSKAHAAADVINKVVYEFVMRCSQGKDIKNYFDIGVIGYGFGDNMVGSAYEGPLAGRDLVSIGEVANNPLTIEEREKMESDGAGGVVSHKIKFPTWFSPVSEWNTPMCRTLEYAHGILEGYVTTHQQSYPPIVINITDGESTDGNPTAMAQQLTSLATLDGNVLLYNCHLSTNTSKPIEFPDNEACLPDIFSKTLFEISSVLPETTLPYAQKAGYALTNNSRGFVFNADFTTLVKFLDIGTRTNVKDS